MATISEYLLLGYTPTWANFFTFGPISTGPTVPDKSTCLHVWCTHDKILPVLYTVWVNFACFCGGVTCDSRPQKLNLSVVDAQVATSQSATMSTGQPRVIKSIQSMPFKNTTVFARVPKLGPGNSPTEVLICIVCDEHVFVGNAAKNGLSEQWDFSEFPKFHGSWENHR